MTALHAHGTARRGELELNVSLDVAAGEVVALVGPNGSGKSSTLDALLGWLPMVGEISVAGAAVGQLPPHRRGLGWCPQRPGLPPRATIASLLRRAADGDGARAAAMHELLLGSAPARAGACSGGQAQRVALARALLSSQVVLLDEPLAAQDVAGTVATRAAIRAHAADGGAVLLVAHRPDDLTDLVDRVIVLEDGRVKQTGTLAEVAARPTTAHAARVLGTTVLSGVVTDDHVLHGDWGSLRVADSVAPGPTTVLVRPAAVSLSTTKPSAGSQRNVLEAQVTSVAAHIEGVTVSLDAAPALRALVTDDAAATMQLRPGLRLWAAIKAADLMVE